MKKKILCIAPLPPPVHGSAMMTKYIKDSKLINESCDLDWINLSTSRRMDEIGKISISKILRFMGAYFKTFWKLLINHYNICYIALTCHGLGFLKDAPFAMMCKLFGYKLIIHQHNKGMKKDSVKIGYRWLFKQVYKNARVVLLSWRLYPDIKEIVNKKQVIICPNGIPEAPKCLKQSHNRPIILFLSNLIESKGVIILLDACKEIKEKGYDFECRYVGGETKEINYSILKKEIKSRGLEKNVVYVGKKYDKEKYEELGNADIFVFPTSYENETFGLVLLEAMQQSVPIITTDEGGIPDIVIDNVTGIIVKSRSHNELANAIIRLLDDPIERQRLAKNGLKRYSNFFTLRNFEENIVEIFETL